MKSAAGVLFTVLVLVGLPLGALAVGGETASPVHPASTRAIIEQQIRAELKRDGVKRVQCGWTSDPIFTVQCNGTREDGSIEGDDDFLIGQDGR
jgi:hypothetical protein